jgi:hypothetical protein
MQEMALGSMLAPQAGHLLPPPAPAAGMLGSWNSIDEADAAPAWLPAVPARAAAPTAALMAPPGTTNIL